MHAHDLMTREVHTCRAQDTLAEAARKMWEHDVGWLPVLNERGGLVSVVTDRDVCMGALFNGVSVAEARVESVMSRRLVTCLPDVDLADVEATLQKEQLRRLPVVGHDGHLVGVITLSDVVRGLQREIDEAERLLRTTHVDRNEGLPSSEAVSVDALADVIEKSRVVYRSCSHALAATETLAKVTEPRGENAERVEFRTKFPVSELSYYRTHDGDDVWIYE